MQQQLLSGLGNVYKWEVLFLYRVHPELPNRRLSVTKLASLVDGASGLLRRNRGELRRRTRFSARGGPRYWISRHDRQPRLKCGTAIERVPQGGQRRSSYFCPDCQSKQPG